MAVIKKILKLNSIGISKAKENFRCKHLNKKLSNLDNDEMLKEKLNKKIIQIKNKENYKRENTTKELEELVKTSKKVRKNKNKELNFVDKVQKQFEGIPIITVIDDAVEGASGIEKVKQIVEKNPEEPLNWLILAETIKYYKKTFLIMNIAKSPIDFVGTLMDIGMEFGGEFLEKTIDKNKWTYERCLLKCLNLSIKDNSNLEKTCICVGKSAKLLAEKSSEPLQRENLLIISEKYLNKALVICEENTKNEILFYLEKISKDKVKKFKYGINNSLFKSTFGATVNVILKQSKKVKNTSEVVLDVAINKFIKKK